MTFNKLFNRLIIYQIILFNFYLKIKNIKNSSLELKDKYYLNSNHFGLKLDFMDKLFIAPELILYFIIAIELISAILAILGSKFGAFVSALLLGLQTLFYHNPLLLENKTSNELFGLKFEFFLNIGVILVMLVDTFSTSSQPDSVVAKSYKKENQTVSDSSKKKGKNKNIAKN